MEPIKTIGQKLKGGEFRDIPGFPGYRIGSDGSVWSAWKWTVRPTKRLFIGNKWRRMNPLRTWQNKLLITLYCDGKPSRFLVHRLVLSLFVGQCPSGMEACHYDGNGSNNHISNLRWDTHKNNEADKIRHGTNRRKKQYE